MVQFKILQKSGRSRVGKLTTPHGVIDTPNFIPVGTQATVKALSVRDLEEIGVQVVLGNTYHLMLRPGADLIEKFGGLHKFMSWDKPIMTDSGGFQVFSLGVGLESGEGKVLKEVGNEDLVKGQKVRLAKVEEKGVTFQSHLDGSKRFLGPRESIKIQHQLGADLIVAFDDHESSKHTKEEMKRSLELTERWALRSLDAYRRCHSEPKAKNLPRMRDSNNRPLMYGVVHGGTNKELRIRSARFTDENFEAIAIGGIYGKRRDLYQIVDWVVENISEEKIRHLLGIGEVEDLFNGVEKGVDLFDCVAPMRRARNGSLYISPKNSGSVKNSFTLNIRLSKYALDKKPIDHGCLCYTCGNFSRAYLNHLYRANEILFHNLATYHNVYFITNLLKKIREAIGNKQFDKLRGAFCPP
ncbi:MAG: tRNA guanosine(34) transglycosylase Tgt [Candidatus Daviesbacteria bacterium]|nr:tRNA guanosine(34) transglycosylase Tgt [Candidatus Daviesbacteria bacterium]